MLTIDLPVETERRLRIEASRLGVDPTEYGRNLIERSLLVETTTRSLWEALTPEEWQQETRQWSESHREWPVLPLQAYERATFYEGKD